jgi:hypothetical protein
MKMWLVLIELYIPAGDKPHEVGFMNLTTWADSKHEAIDKIRIYLESFSWQVVGIEKSEPLEQESDYADELTGMIERTRVNANAIILGNFHRYKMS